MSGNPTRRRLIQATGTLLAGGAMAGCSAPTADEGDNGNGAGRRTVEMTDDFEFVPDAISISSGDTIVWENVGSLDHSVTAYEDEIPDDAGYFASGGHDSEQAARDAFPEGALGGDDSFEHTFDATGTYAYFCIPHEGAGMTGTIDVE